MRAALGVLTLVLVLLGAGTAAAAPPPPTFFGIESKDTAYGNAAYQTANLDLQRGIGVRTMRQWFDWAAIEPQKGNYKWGTYDVLMAQTARRGMEVLPILFGESPWGSSRPPAGGNNGYYPPGALHNDDFGQFAAAIAKRYGPNGSFWAANPTIPKQPIRAYQIWNEPHVPAYWPDGPSPAQYVAMLKATTPKVKAVDPGAEIVAAGISESGVPGAIGLRDYITGMYAAGGNGYFDTLAIHPYATTVPGTMYWLDVAKQVATSKGDPNVGMRVTEIGWASGGPSGYVTTTEAGQAANLTGLFTELVRRRQDLNLKGVVWYSWHDAPPEIDWWAKYTGLLRLNGTFKPSYYAYRDVVARLLAQGGAGTGGANATGDFVGVAAPELLSSSSAGRTAALGSQAVLGVGALRQVFDWRRIERRPGRYSFARYDDLVASAAQRGIRVLAVLDDPPRFRTRHGRRGTVKPPRHNAAMARFARALVRRYGPKGVLWRKRPQLAKLPIRSWQVWQEPNSPRHWGGRTSARGYAALLRAVRRQIKRTDQTAEVVSAALANGRGAVAPLRFLSAVYRAGGRAGFDVLGLAPYRRSAKGVLRDVGAARRLMLRRGHRRAKIWITSFGWAADGRRSSLRVGRQGQATRIRQALRLFALRRKHYALRGVVYVAWRDRRGGGWTRRAGLLDSRGREKPAFRAFKGAVRALL